MCGASDIAALGMAAIEGGNRKTALDQIHTSHRTSPSFRNEARENQRRAALSVNIYEYNITIVIKVVTTL